MAKTFYDNDGGAGDQKYTTPASWDTAAVPVDGDEAILTDVRTATSMLGETATLATWPDKILVTRYSGDIGSSGTHLAFDHAAGSQTLDELSIEDAGGSIYMDFDEAAGSNTVTDTHINVPGRGSTKINLGGAAAFTNVHLLRGRTNLGMTGTITDLWVAHSTTPRDVHADIASGATVTNIRQGGGLCTCASAQAIALWLQQGGSTVYSGGNTITDYYLFGGNLRMDGSSTPSTITNLYIYAGIADFTKTGHLRTVTNVFVWPTGTFDTRHVESLVSTTKIVTYGAATIMGNKPVTTAYL